MLTLDKKKKQEETWPIIEGSYLGMPSAI